MAGMAKTFSWAYSKRRRTSSPTMTPDLRESFSRTPMLDTDGGDKKSIRAEVGRSVKRDSGQKTSSDDSLERGGRERGRREAGGKEGK